MTHFLFLYIYYINKFKIKNMTYVENLKKLYYILIVNKIFINELGNWNILLYGKSRF
jgi:hypothetical protein